MDLKFEDLLDRALSDWPSELDLSILEKSGSDVTRYTIKGLSDMENMIDERYYGTEDEILLRNLHSAIYTVLHKVAAHVTHVRLADLRPEAIRVSFESFLRGCMEGPDPTFSPADIQVVSSTLKRINHCRVNEVCPKSLDSGSFTSSRLRKN